MRNNLKFFGGRDSARNFFYELKEISKITQSIKRIFFDLKGFIKKPLSHVSHLAILLIILLVFLSNLFSKNFINFDKIIDPFGVSKLEIKEEKLTADDFQTTATLASVLREELAEDAFNLANEKSRGITIAMASADYFVKPTIIVTANAAQGNQVREYIVKDGDTLWSIARANNITTDTIRWANDISDIDYVKPGTKLLIPPIVGVLHTVKAGETIKGIASRYSASAAQIESYNNIIDEELAAGMKIMVPDGVGPDLPEKKEPEKLLEKKTQIASSVPSSVSYSRGPNKFPWGYCTWWVAAKRYIPWSGNAWQWYGNAKAYGYATGGAPVPGSIYVSWDNPYYGHVSYVESVSGNSFTISEMNYRGYGIINTRTVPVGAGGAIGFIY